LPQEGDISQVSRNRRSTNEQARPQRASERGEIGLDAADIFIRQLTPGDAALYRSIRLEGLKESPEAFGSTFEAEFTKPLAWFFDRLSSSVVFGAIRDAKIQGVTGFAVRQEEKEAHKGLLWGMYVRPDARGAGIARRLVEAVIAYARPHAELIQLSVVVGNEQARRLYARLGFVEYGIEKNSLKFRGRYFDEILMAKDLGSDSVPEKRAPAAGRSNREPMPSLITST
jgi:RimJ/RimL family protein N-acetyltransferase